MTHRRNLCLSARSLQLPLSSALTYTVNLHSCVNFEHVRGLSRRREQCCGSSSLERSIWSR